MLQTGATIAIVAPSGIFDPERLNKSRLLLKQWGYNTVESPNLHAKHLFTAGTPKDRTNDFIWALDNQQIDGIFFARGGYGTSHILPNLPYHDFPNTPIFGFSDATALMCALWNSQKGTFVHSPVLHSLSDHPDDHTKSALQSLMLTGRSPSLEGEPLCGPQTTVTGPIVGGNLCVITSLIGTPFQLQTDETILLLEDLSEPPYKVHRMLTQLKMSGLLDKVVAIGLGEFLNCHPPNNKKWTLKDCFIDVLKPLKIPVIWKLPFGHGKRNTPWILGTKYTVSGGILHVEPN